MTNRAVLILLVCCGVTAAWKDPCPGGWFQYFERCFKFDSSPRTWIDAEQYCQSVGGNLASIHSADEYLHVQHTIHKLTNAYPVTWLGGWDAAQEYVWLWSDGSKFDFSQWNPDEPNNAGGRENCIEMNAVEGITGATEFKIMWWNDVPCDLQRPTLCSLN